MIKGEQKPRNFTVSPSHLASFPGHPKLSEFTLHFQETYISSCHVVEYFFVVVELQTDTTFIRRTRKLCDIENTAD